MWVKFFKTLKGEKQAFYNIVWFNSFIKTRKFEYYKPRY